MATSPFQTSAFFSTLRDIDKQKSDKRLEEKRFGLQERQVAGSERRQEFVESEAQRTQKASEAKVEREKNIKLIEATIKNTGRSLAQLSLESGKNTDELKFTEEMNKQLEQLSLSAENLGLFSKAEVQQMLQTSIDDELTRGLEASTVGVRNVIDSRTGVEISETAAREQIRAGTATAANFTIAPTKARVATGGPDSLTPRKVGTAEQQNIRNAAVQVNSIRRSLSSAREALKFNPASASFTGELEQFADNLGNNLTALVDDAIAAGFTDADGKSFTKKDVDADIGRLRTLLKGKAGPVAQFNSALIDASYSKALILNGARPTDEDVIQAYNSLTGGSNDPNIIIQRFDQAERELIQNVKDRARLAGMDDLGSFFEDVSGAGGGVDPVDVEGDTGTVDGVPWIFRNGKWVKQ